MHNFIEENALTMNSKIYDEFNDYPILNTSKEIKVRFDYIRRRA
jgi:hypothetical protein